MADKASDKRLFILIGILFVVLGGVYALSLGPLEGADDVQAATEQAEVVEEEASPPAAEIDVQAALSPRILGDPSAPVKISEHSSFTCGHCGKFHKDIYPQIKANYVDTGKIYILFSDFPLNAPALHASMVARCLPADIYFDFMQMLFEKQEDWAYSPQHLEKLETMARENGMDKATFQGCINNQELRQGLIDRMQAAGKQWEIKSTPSFVINNKTTISGASDYDFYAKAIDEELRKLESGNTE